MRVLLTQRSGEVTFAYAHRYAQQSVFVCIYCVNRGVDFNDAGEKAATPTFPWCSALYHSVWDRRYCCGVARVQSGGSESGSCSERLRAAAMMPLALPLLLLLHVFLC